jgi:CHAT domain-containing protein/Tfp pilus assembly protein PilF
MGLPKGAQASPGEPLPVLLPGVDLNHLDEDWELEAAIPEAELFLGQRVHTLGAEDFDVTPALLSLGILYRQKRAYDRAEPLLARALSIREKALGPEHALVAEVVHAMALLYRKARRYDRADTNFQRALRIREKVLGAEDPLVAYVLDDLGVLYRRMCVYDRAESFFLRARSILEKARGPEHADVAVTHNHLAMLYWARGELGRCETFLLQALEIREKALAPDHPDIAATLKNLGVLNRDRGEYDLAASRFEQARSILQKALGPDHIEVGRTIFNLAQLYRKREQVERAEPLLDRALSIAEKALGPNEPEVASCLDELGVIDSKRGDFVRAETRFKRAIAIFEKTLGPEHPDLAQVLNHLSLMYLWKGDVTRAERPLLRALAIQERALGPDHFDVARTLSTLSGFFTIRGNMVDAVRTRARGAGIRDQQAEIILAAGAEERKRAYMDTLKKDTDAIVSLHVLSAPSNDDAAKAALTTILRRKGRVLDAMTDSLLTLRRHLTPEAQALLDRRSAIFSELAALASLSNDGMSGEERLSRVSQLNADRQRIDTEVSRLSAEFRAERRPVSIEQVAKLIPEGGALLEVLRYQPFYAVPGRVEDHRGKPRYVIYRLDRGGHVAAVDLGEADRIDAAVAKLRKALSDPTRDPRPAARALDELVMQPVRALIADTRAVWISPDGELNLVPFGALIDEEGRYLIDRYAFTYLTSGRDLIRFGTAAPSREAPAVIANPDFGSAAPSSPRLVRGVVLRAALPAEAPSATRPSRGIELRDITFPPLPGTAAEAKDLERRIEGARMFTGLAATETQIKALRGPWIVHVATHGFFLPAPGEAVDAARALDRGGSLDPSAAQEEPSTMPLESALLRAGLAFAGANEHKSGDEDGVLTALEAAALDLYGTKLIVLSACETGIGEVRSGDGVYGLRRALVMAGAETQVMSLWKVDDEATRALMGAYYAQLDAGVGRSDAMRKVQRVSRMDEKTSHPYYWASFIVSGAAAPLGGTVRGAGLGGEVLPGPRGHCTCALVGSGGGDRAPIALLLLGAAIAARRVSRSRSRPGSASIRLCRRRS